MSRQGGCLIGFLELRQEPGVYSRVTAGMAIQNSTLFSEVRTPGSLHEHDRNLNLVWQDNTNFSGGEVGDHASLSSFQKNLGIPINFQEGQASSPLKH